MPTSTCKHETYGILVNVHEDNGTSVFWPSIYMDTLAGTFAFAWPPPKTNFPAALLVGAAVTAETGTFWLEDCDVEPTAPFSGAMEYFKGFPSRRLPTPENALNFGASGSFTSG